MSDAKIVCPVCGDSHAAPNGDADYLLRNVSRCDLCDARIVYGKVAPKLIVEPSTFDTQLGPRPALLVKVQDVETKATLLEQKLDPQHAFLLAQAIISMVRP